MSSAFADTHNMVAILAKSDVSEGFDQILDFLNGSYIRYALTVNRHIYISCIKQFWNTVTVKQSTDVTSLVRNVDSSSKFYMYPRFIQLIIKNQLGDLSTQTTKYISFALTQKVFANMRRVGKGFLVVETPLFKGMLVVRENVEADIREEQVPDDTVVAAAQEVVTTVTPEDVLADVLEDVHDESIPSPAPPTLPPQPFHDIPSTSQAQSPLQQPQSSTPAQPQGADFLMNLLQTALDACAALTLRVEHLKHDKEAQTLEIAKLKTQVNKLERENKVKAFILRRLKKVGISQRVETFDDTIIEDVSNQGRMIVELDRDEGVELIGVIIRDPKEESTPIKPTKIKSKDKDKGIMIEEPKPMKKKDQVELDEEYARKLHEELNKEIDWDMDIDHMKQKAKEDKIRMEEEEEREIASINKTSAQKAAKRRKLNEEAKEVDDLKQHLEIVPDEDDDVYTEATPLARKCYKDAAKLKLKLLMINVATAAIAITLDLPTVKPGDSLSIGDEHLDTISETESDEFIKSSVENLVPNPSESKDLSDRNLFEPYFDEEIISIKIDPHHFNVESDLIESFLNHDSSNTSSSSKIDSLLNEIAGELILLKSIPPGNDEADCDPEKEICLIKKLLYDNSSPRPPKEFISKNSDAAIKSFSPSPILVEDSDSLIEEIDLSLTSDDSIPPGIEDDDCDSKRDILILEELFSSDSFSLPENKSFHFDIPSFPRPPAKPSDDDEIKPNLGMLNVKVVVIF
nr:hypothetical protein [Tanacetum cinerariifolium]